MRTITVVNTTNIKIRNETFHMPAEFKEVNRENSTTETTVLFEKDKKQQ